MDMRSLKDVPRDGPDVPNVPKAKRKPFNLSTLAAPMGRRIRDAAASAYQRTVVELILRRKHIAASTEGRHIPLAIEHDAPLVDTRRGASYVSNDIRTSRYTVWDFIPKQLFFQFSRVGNFYFLCVGIPQTVRTLQTNLILAQMANSTRYPASRLPVPSRRSCRYCSLCC